MSGTGDDGTGIAIQNSSTIKELQAATGAVAEASCRTARAATSTKPVQDAATMEPAAKAVTMAASSTRVFDPGGAGAATMAEAHEQTAHGAPQPQHDSSAATTMATSSGAPTASATGTAGPADATIAAQEQAAPCRCAAAARDRAQQ